uniref:Embryo-specific protein ATS3A-like n=1 Tax=Cicer arietinum TaxID=3827 RepID=A0A1S2XEV9_CICAR|nr:embryo-specific protein ATS3A-like [Cicer arietinum]
MQYKEINKIMKTLILILIFSIIVVFSQTTPTLLTRFKHQTNQYSTLYDVQPQNVNVPYGTCKYMITIKTSCLSPIHTRDIVGISFGDANGFSLVVWELGDPESRRFEQCMTTIFWIAGPCIDQICKLFLYRNGTDSWIPESVIADDYRNPPITFYYNAYIPNDGFGYGHDFCIYKA